VASSPVKVGLFGRFGVGNLGNDGSMEAMLAAVRRMRPGAQVVCICDGPEVVARIYRLPTVPMVTRTRPAGPLFGLLNRALLKLPARIAELFHAIAALRPLDVLLVPGTGILDDFGESPLGTPSTIFTWCLAARLAGTPLAFISIGAGPIEHALSRWLMKAGAALAQYRSYRDAKSRDFMNQIGFDARDDPIFPDIAFQLPVPPPAGEGVPVPGGSGLTVGLGVMTYYGWRCDATTGAATMNAYIDKLAAFVGWLLDQGHRVRVMLGDQDDRLAVDRLLGAVASARPGLAPGRLYFEPADSLHEVMRQMGTTDLVVATRFHNVVCALKLAKPTISLSYAAKNDVLMADMGVGEFCQHIERFELDLLTGQFSRLLAAREDVAQRIRTTAARYQRQLEQQNETLAARFL
jgi:polysaccharide pyruvyl transferase WcaK-like protein